MRAFSKKTEHRATAGPAWLAVGLAAAAGMWPAGRSFGQAPGPQPVEVAPAVVQELAPTTRLVGTVGPQLRTVLATEVAGVVAEMLVDEGDRVEPGQPICKLRDERQRLVCAESRAREAELAAMLSAQTAEMTKAKFEADRTSRLWEQKRCTEKEWSDAQADRAVAAARVEQARSALEAQKAATSILTYDLDRMGIRSPCAGHVVAKRTDVGAWLSEGGPVVELVDLSTVRVRVSVPESMVQFCQPGAAAEVSVEALGKDYIGEVARVVPDADKQARTFPVEIDLPNPDGELKAGMFARAAVPSGPRTEQLVVSKDAVVVRGPMSMVYVVRGSEQGHVAMPLPVQVVSEVLDQVAIATQGLGPGDLVVVRGNEFMFGPTPVIPMPRADGQGGQPAPGMPGGPRPSSMPAEHPPGVQGGHRSSTMPAGPPPPVVAPASRPGERPAPVGDAPATPSSPRQTQEAGQAASRPTSHG